MFLGYNTNGLAHHDLFDAVELLAEIGYRGVAITIDHNALPPGGRYAGQRLTRLRHVLGKQGMRSVIETGARFLLDPRTKHEPTLMSESPRRRIDFYKYAVDCAAELGSDCVSLWSGVFCGAGVPPANAAGTACSKQWHTTGTAAPQAMDRLVAGLCEVLDYAARQNVVIAFEPEPGMFIDTMAAFEELLMRLSDRPETQAGVPLLGTGSAEYDRPRGHCLFQAVAHGSEQCEPLKIETSNMRLTLDIGHLQCQSELPIPEVIRRWSSRLANVHIEDMRRGVHEHLMFGEGEIDFPPILRTLAEVGYTGGVYVELSRHSHEGPTAARKAFEFLTERMRDSG